MATVRPFVVGWAGALVAAGLLAASAHALAGLAGNVTKVDLDTRKLVVTEAGTDRDVVVMVNDQTMIVTNAGKAITLGDLRKGDVVGISEVGGIATQIVVKPLEIKGVVNAVDPSEKRLVVTEAGTDQDVTLSVGDQTAIETQAGQRLELRNLKTGDGVAVTHTGAVAERIVVNIRPDELTGFIKSVGGDQKTLVVTDLKTNTDISVVITDRTTIVTTTGKDLRFQDLKRGDGVGIAHHRSVAEKIVVNVKPIR